MGSRDSVKEVFAKFDHDGDGLIQKEELAGVLQGLDADKFDEDAVTAMFEAMDSDGNGEVTLDEFLDWVFGEASMGKEMRRVVEAALGSYGPPEQEAGELDAEDALEECQDVAEELEVGDFVRVQEGVTPKHNWGKVKPGDVGIVAAVAGDDCRVNFAAQGRWRGLCSEMEKVDALFAEGDTLRVRRGVDPPKFKWGKVVKGEHGVLTKIDGPKCRVDFVSQKNWLGYLPEMEKVPEEERQDLQVGDHVKVKDCVTTPKFKWGSVAPGEVGCIVELQEEGKARVAFKHTARWLAFLPELEKVRVEPGWRVRLRGGAEWEGVEPEVVGRIAGVEEAEGLCTVDFEEVQGIQGPVSDLQLLPVLAGDSVRVRPSVKSPKCGWGRVKPEDVGVLKEIGSKCLVDFPSQSGWKCLYGELEQVSEARDSKRYPQAGSRVRVREDVKEPKFKWGKVKHGHVGEVASVDGLKCRVQFPALPEGKLWLGWLPEMEEVKEEEASEESEEVAVDWAARGFKPGRTVKVQDGVDPPKYNWGPVKPGDQGRIREVVGDTAKVDFKGCRKLWRAHLPEMELVEEPAEEEGAEEDAQDGEEGEGEGGLFSDGYAEDGIDGKGLPLENWLRPGRGEGLMDVAVGMVVRVKSSVEKPVCGWGCVKPGDEGELKEINGKSCKVNFERQKGLWNGRVSEMESANPSEGQRVVKLFGEIQPQDLKQGQLGDCWLIAAMAALAEFPEAVRLPFREKTWSERGRYTVKLFCLKSKEWKTFRIDDRLPTKDGGTVFAGLSAEGELWPVLLEKAFAALWGGYPKLRGGWGPTGWAVLTGCENAYSMRKRDGGNAWRRRKMKWDDNGSPAYWFAPWPDGSKGTEEKPTEELLDLLVEWDRCNYLMCASAHMETSDDKFVEGIVQSHEYSLIRVVKDVGSGSSTSLLQLRNPWGRKEWTGPWSDDSEEWKEHPEVKELLGHQESDDGLFWMAIEDFGRLYDTVCVLEKEMPPKQA